MIHSFGPLFQDALDRLLQKGETRSDLIQTNISFSDKMGRRIARANDAGVPGLTNLRLTYNTVTRLFSYINNIDEKTILVEKNPQLIMNEAEGPIGIEVTIRETLPETLLEAAIGQPLNCLSDMPARLKSLIGHLNITSFEADPGRTIIRLDDQPYRIRLSAQ